MLTLSSVLAAKGMLCEPHRKLRSPPTRSSWQEAHIQRIHLWYDRDWYHIKSMFVCVYIKNSLTTFAWLLPIGLCLSDRLCIQNFQVLLATNSTVHIDRNASQRSFCWSDQLLQFFPFFIGFLCTLLCSEMPPYLVWIPQISFIKYGVEAMVINEWYNMPTKYKDQSGKIHCECSVIGLTVNEIYVSGQGRNVTLAHKHTIWVYTTVCCGDT